MPLETINYISDLNAANPAVSDGLVQGDDHLRGIKAALKNTLPNFTAAALTSAQAEIDAVAHTGQLNAQDGSAGAPSISFKNDATTGFRKGARAGQTAIAGTLRGAGAVSCGAIVDFPKVPPGLGSEWLELDGSVYTLTTFPDLGAFLGNTFGGDGVLTFGVPNLKDTGRFRRSRTATLTAGTYQANAFKTHAHTGASADAAGGHTHDYTDAGHSHNFVIAASAPGGGSGDGGNAGTVTKATANATVNISITAVGNHTHTLTIPSGGDGGATETRPESFVCVTCIKT